MSAVQPSVFLSHSSAGDPAVAHVRTRLDAALRQRTTLQVLLDQRMLGGGDEWQPVLHQWLGECDSAVLLLSPGALASGWVQKEATILTWRRSLGSRLRLLPVLIGCSRQEVVTHPAFAPLDLGGTQFLDLAADPLADADLTDPVRLAALDAKVDLLLDSLLDQLSTVEVEAADLPMRRWVRDVTVALDAVADSYLLEAAAALGVSPQVQAEVTNLRATVAHQLLNATLKEVHRALQALSPRHLPAERYRWLVDLVAPVWVPALAGRNFLDAAAASVGRRTVAIKALREQTGVHHVARATCGQEAGQVITVNDVTGIDEGSALSERYERAMWRATGLSGPFRRDQLALYLADEEGRQYVLLGPEAAAAGLDEPEDDPLRSLFQSYREAVFVALVGGDRWDSATASDHLTCLSPELGQQEEDRVDILLAKIEGLHSSRTGGPTGAGR